ncbi:MAG: trypsin-like peptidase domain-containing protein [Pseudonocardiaceae bacterium]
MGVDQRVAGFLGRILNDADDPIGTCFQVSPGVLVTAWHVLDDLGVGAIGTEVRLDPLQGGPSRAARVVRLDPLHDLAVLVAEEPLAECVAGLAASDEVAVTTPVAITGVVTVDDPGHSYRHLDADGHWAGGTTRDDQILLGRVVADAVMKGMSGSPVLAGQLVVGVVWGRYNSTDGWGRNSVWVARTEDLAPLLVGHVEITMSRLREDESATLPRDSASFTVEEKKRLDRAVSDLAGAVGRQWTQEAAVRSLRRPEPIRIRWSSTGRPVAASLADVLTEGVVPGRPVRLRHDVHHVVELFRVLRARQLVVLGDPGAGKTVLALLFTLGLLDSPLSGEPVPVLLTASSWDPRTEHLHKWMTRRILEEYPALANHDVYGADAAERMVTEGRVMAVLDGLDEISAALLPEVLDALDAAVAAKYPLVVTCRGTEYEAAVARSGRILTRAAVLEIEPVDLDDVATFLMATGPTAQDRWGPVVDKLRSNRDVPLAQALTSPLMVSLARTVYAAPTSDPSELLDFANKAAVEHHLLEAFIPAAYHQTPPAPGTPSTPEQVRYPPEQARRWLTFLARHLDTLATPDLAWWQLVDTISRTTCGISVGLTVGLVFGFAGFVSGSGIPGSTYRLESGLEMGLVFGLATGLSYGVSKRPAPLRVETRFQEKLALLLSRFVIGFAIGVGVGFGVALPYGAALTIGVAFGFAFAAPVCLDIPAKVAQVSSPGVVLKQDRAAVFLFGLILTLPIGLIDGLVVWFPSGPAFGVFDGVEALLSGTLVGGVAGGVLGGRMYGRVGRYVFAIVGAVTDGFLFDPNDTVPHPIIGLVSGVIFGLACGCVGVLSRAWGAYAVSRIWLALRGDVPWRLMRFLDDAHHRGVLRQSGAVYQFRHSRLQDHLAHDRADSNSRDPDCPRG